MKKNATKFTLGFLLLFIIAGIGYWTSFENFSSQEKFSLVKQTGKELDKISGENEEEEAENRIELKKARSEYFFRLLRDPATNSIPKNIRRHELNHARNMPTLLEVNRQRKTKNPSIQVAEGFNWRLAGPPAVGGRTRALGIDQRNSDIVIAGGVSGGIWRSTNGGDSWTLRTPNFDSFSVTSLAQNPTAPDTWYYTAGEFSGNSASGRNRTATYYGTGIFQSTDNGLTWTRISGTEDDDASFTSQYDFITRIIISPTTGTVFYTSNGIGIYRSPNGNFNNGVQDFTLGGVNEHQWVDVAVASNGTLAAVLSSSSLGGTTSGNPGIFVSNDDGQSWNEITPTSFPSEHGRSVITFAPSDPNTVYVFTQKLNDETNQGVSFYKLDLSSNPLTAQDRSVNLPNFDDGQVGGVNLQGGYNMTVAVKPDNPNIVTLGGTNLFRSFDGFSTGPADNSDAEKDEFWIGGYAKANNVNQYPNNHPDQHVQVYDPNNPNRMWSGHDGGLSVTNDITATDVSWTERNDGYIVTQFYDASIGLGDNDSRLLGGTQDNGTPLFSFDGQQTSSINDDISSGDGGFSFFTENFIFASVQKQTDNSPVFRFNNTGSFQTDVQPDQAQTAFFINPYTLDPNDEGIMYYPGGSSLFRSTSVDEAPQQIQSSWSEVTASATPGFNISALAVTTNPADILYYAGSNSTSAPVIKRLDKASSSNDQPNDISIPNAPAGAFVHDIAINPINGNDVLVTMANYNIIGLYHTTDGGNSWQAVEGNLTGGGLQGNLDFGPSIRSATIIPAVSGTIYMVGTSTGVYATQNLNGDNTVWGRESPFDNDNNDDIGFSVIENITSRLSDGDVAVGSHGRGMFLGKFQGQVAQAQLNPRIVVNNSANQNNTDAARAGDQVTITAFDFQFSSDISKQDITFGEATLLKNIVEITPTQLTVIVPRGAVARDADQNNDGNFDITVTVQTASNGKLTDDFEIIPPGENELSQNFPNPFSVGQGTNIPISLQNNSSVTINIYSTSGQRVDQLLKDDQYQAGTYDIPVNFSGMASGIYIYQIIAKPTGSTGDTFVDSEKFTFIR